MTIRTTPVQNPFSLLRSCLKRRSRAWGATPNTTGPLAASSAELQALSPLRIISQTGPSTFEAICSLGPWGVSQGYLNAITDAYHWHLDLGRFRHLRSADQTHARSGRRVLFFELREAEGADPFLLIYLYRAPKEEFGGDREERFVALHAELAQGRELALDAEAA